MADITAVKCERNQTILTFRSCEQLSLYPLPQLLFGVTRCSAALCALRLPTRPRSTRDHRTTDVSACSCAGFKSVANRQVNPV